MVRCVIARTLKLGCLQKKLVVAPEGCDAHNGRLLVINFVGLSRAHCVFISHCCFYLRKQLKTWFRRK